MLLSDPLKPSTVCKKTNFTLQSISVLWPDTNCGAKAGAGVAGGVSGQDRGQVLSSPRDVPVLRILLSLPTTSLATTCCDDATWRTHQASESRRRHEPDEAKRPGIGCHISGGGILRVPALWYLGTSSSQADKEEETAHPSFLHVFILVPARCPLPPETAGPAGHPPSAGNTTIRLHPLRARCPGWTTSLTTNSQACP